MTTKLFFACCKSKVRVGVLLVFTMAELAEKTFWPAIFP